MEQEGKIDEDEEKQGKTHYLVTFHCATKNICVLLDFSAWQHRATWENAKRQALISVFMPNYLRY